MGHESLGAFNKLVLSLCERFVCRFKLQHDTTRKWHLVENQNWMEVGRFLYRHNGGKISAALWVSGDQREPIAASLTETGCTKKLLL